MKERTEEKQGKGAETQTKILRAARIIFSNHPYHVASIRMVGKEGGFDHPLVSYYFPSKEKLFEAVIIEMIDEFNQYRDYLYEGLETLSIEDGLSLFIDKMIAFHLKSPELFRTIMQNTVYIEKLEDIPGLQLLIDFLSSFIESLQENIPVKASSDEISKLVYNFSVLIINYLGAESCWATVLGMETNSLKYREWVKDTLKHVFKPLLKKMIVPRGRGD